MHRKQNFQAAIFIFTFSPPLFFHSSCLVFYFLLAGHLVGYISEVNVFGIVFRILGFDARKGRWVVEQDFQRDFRINIACFFFFFAFFLGLLD